MRALSSAALLLLTTGFGLVTSCADGAPESEASNEVHHSDAGSSKDAAKDGAQDAKTDSALPDSGGAEVSGDVGSCTPANCVGCCRIDGSCASGSVDDACGTAGTKCVDCVALGTACKAGACLSCNPVCWNKDCGASDGCGGSCQAGSGCCAPKCAGKPCGVTNECTGSCQPGSGCCSPSCSGVGCGASDGCGGSCQPGSGCCSPNCGGASCGAGDGCGGFCSGSCPPAQKCEANGGSFSCECGPSPTYKMVGGDCLPSCGHYLGLNNLPNAGGGCCTHGCAMQGSGPNETWDCPYCCSSIQSVPACAN